jgi:hypothetical protein
MDAIIREPQSNNNFFATHQMIMSTLPHLLPQLKYDINPLFNDPMERGCCCGCLYHDNQYFLVVCEGLIVYVNLVVSVVVSEYFLAIFVPDIIL